MTEERAIVLLGYDLLSMEVIWETVTTSLPDLIAALPSIIQSAPGSRSDSNGDA